MTLFKYIVVLILTWQARLVLARYKPKIIAVTGSVGKTTTKDTIYTVLSKTLHVRKSEKSFNSEIGVPLTILGCGNAWNSPVGWLKNFIKGMHLIFVGQKYPEWLVLEVGADRPGDIRAIAQWLRPDVSVITAIPDVPVHVEYFDSPDQVAKEKRELAVWLKERGHLIVNGDDARTKAIHDEFRGVATTFGFGTCDFRASHDEFAYEGESLVGLRFRVNHSGSSVPVLSLGALGKAPVYAALAALAVAKAVGLDIVSASSALSAHVPPPGRMRLIAGKEGAILIDDTYNSSPIAAHAALETLINIPSAKKRIAILGDMLELGKFSTEEHKKLGRQAAECADLLVTVGFRAKTVATAAREAGLKHVREYEQGDAEKAGRDLIAELGPKSVVLIKGSQGMRLERAVKQLMAEPERAAEFLVRQEEEWRKR